MLSLVHEEGFTASGPAWDRTKYHYDPAGRLEQVDENGFLARIYSYDSNGNRLSLTDGAAVTSGTYDDQDRLQTYGTKTYTHNAAGDLTQLVDSSLPAGQQATLYAYDALGNLTQVDLPDGRIVTYVIDGQNRRVGKKVDGTLVQGWLYQDPLNPVAELDGAGNVVARFVYGTRPNVPDYMVKGGVTYRIVSDHQGSPRLVIDESDSNPATAVVQRIDYDEFGQVTQNTSAAFQPFGFAGGLYDSDTGFVRLGVRDYEAGAGRWTAKDPIGFGGGSPNLYSYTLGDPVNASDPTGLVVGGIVARGLVKITGQTAQEAAIAGKGIDAVVGTANSIAGAKGAGTPTAGSIANGVTGANANSVNGAVNAVGATSSLSLANAIAAGGGSAAGAAVFAGLGGFQLGNAAIDLSKAGTGGDPGSFYGALAAALAADPCFSIGGAVSNPQGFFASVYGAALRAVTSSAAR